jgi:hypothetical protein
MSVKRIIKNYMNSIDTELGDINADLKRSVMQEIEEHLNDKIEDARKSVSGAELTEAQVKKLLEEFGEPVEIAREYKKQMRDDMDDTFSGRPRGMKRIIVPVLALIIAAALIWVAVSFFIDSGDDNPGPEDNTIIEGKGLEAIQIGDRLDKITKLYGEPDYRNDDEDLIWLDYRDSNGIDFLVLNQTQKIIEIRFNPGYDGATSSGISIGSPLDDALNASGGALNTYQANQTETHSVSLGSDRVLYEQYIEGNLTVYKFIDSKRGILYWASVDREITQIVVFRPN